MNMKKIFVAAIAALFSAASMSAQEVVVINSTDTLVVKAEEDTVTLECAQCDNSGFIAEMERDRGRVHLDFDILFYKKITKPFQRAIVGSFYVGSNITDSRKPFDFNPQNSMEFAFYMLDSHTSGRSSFSFGPGLTWKNFSLTGNEMMLKLNDDSIGLGVPEGAAAKVSKLRVFSFNFPMLYSYSFGNGFGITLGPVVNLNACSSIVNKYYVDGEKMKDKYKNVHCNVLTVDAMVQMNLKYFSIYAKYSPMNLMDKGFWPEFQTWTIGISPF